MSKRSDHSKDQILQAALGLFREKGFSKTSMREIAAEAGVATGASYYYFKSKDEIVSHFYDRLASEFTTEVEAITRKTEDFGERIQRAMAFRFRQLAPYRDSLPVLVRNAVDPTSPLSAFGKHTTRLRAEAVASFALLVRGSNLKVPTALRDEFPAVLWLWHMGVLYQWLIDESKGQTKTQEMINESLKMMTELMRVFVIPGVTDMLQPAIRIFQLMELVPRSTN